VPRRRTAVALLALAALGVVGAGCGADREGAAKVSDEQRVRAVVARFGVASATKDYQTICDRLLAEALVRSVESVGLPCESALQRGLSDVRDPRLQIRQVSLSGARALVSVHSTAAGQPPSDDAIQLVLEHGDWRIASLATPSSSTTPGSTAAPSSATPPTTTTKP
jgi:hypothetical protein